MQLPQDVLKVVFLDVGQGDSIFIDFNNKQVLIDGGPDKSVLEKLNQEMPFYDKTIDMLILTHPDADHLTGLISALDFFNIKHIIATDYRKDTGLYKRWQDLINKKDVNLTLANEVQEIVLDDKVKLEVLWPKKDRKYKKANNASIVMRLVYKNSEIFLAGDIESKIESEITENFKSIKLNSDILKVAHHGSKTSSNKNFLEKVNPKAAIISVGGDNWYGHPHKNVIKRLESIFLFRTDRDGNTEVLTNGQLFQICSEKKEKCLNFKS